VLKFLAKTAEKYAKATNTACTIIFIFHQPKMPASMIKKGE
jgi:cyclic lactone autoinducer peptide